MNTANDLTVVLCLGGVVKNVNKEENVAYFRQGLVFTIVSARIYDYDDDKKHVIYTLQVRFVSGGDDLTPVAIERRYTHFLILYNGLRKEQPQLMLNIPFPPKKLLGNFDNELIATRSTEFESLLKHVSSESKLRETKALINFLQGAELDLAKEFVTNKDFRTASPILETCFKLLNKVFTDRFPVVLLALSRLLCCCMQIPGNQAEVEKWAELLLHRFDGVSDSDLLELYVPLLHTCLKIWSDNEPYKDLILQRLQGLKRSGVKIEENAYLLDEVERIERKIFGDYSI